MSLGPLLLQVQTRLRTTFNGVLLPDQIGIEPPPGNPPASCGEEAITIISAGWDHGPSENQENRGLDEQYTFQVILTRRTGFVPEDRIAEEVIFKDPDGMEYRMRQIIASLLFARFPIQLAANLQETFRWSHCDPYPTQVGPEWFLADPTDSPSAQSAYNTGLTWTATFERARRVSVISPVA